MFGAGNQFPLLVIYPVGKKELKEYIFVENDDKLDDIHEIMLKYLDCSARVIDDVNTKKII